MDKVKFWDTPVGKIVSYGVHEHGNGACSIGAALGTFKLRGQFNEEQLASIERMEKSLERMSDAIDYIYSESKKLYENGTI